MEFSTPIAEPAESFRARAERLEAIMRDMPQLPNEPIHRFANGVYARELTLPKGATAVGKIHKTQHIAVVLKGVCSVASDNGVVELIQAPMTLVCEAGTKRVVYAHEETVWTTFHPCTSQNVLELEQALVADSFEDYQAFVLEQSKPKSLLGRVLKCLLQR